MRVAKRVALGLAVLASLSPPPSLLAQRAAVAREAAVPFMVGETLTYDVSWSSVLVAGTATAQVVEKKASPPGAAYAIVVDGRPVPLVARLYNLYYKMDTLVDSFTLLSRGGSLYSEEGAEKSTVTTRFDRTARRAFFERRSATLEKADISIPADAQDGLAVLYALRGRTFKAGDRFTTPVADSGSMYTVQVDVAAPGPVRVPVGEFTAWNLKGAISDAQGQPVWKDIVVWISNDARRLPVKLQAELPVGTFVLALKEVRN
ncbi:MAG: hypothetical protein A3H97_02785 [Acidobacteria bacterium RIFCSPLOWO2_02_FULL_65_29]|nr:MAG: hypothetical protein A3H97_02785 [Acidobacteria bacterium RIFCSPLOWO2_02_FULL_65_29]